MKKDTRCDACGKNIVLGEQWFRARIGNEVMVIHSRCEKKAIDEWRHKDWLFGQEMI